MNTKTKKGMTLIEVLITALILTVTLAGVAGSMTAITGLIDGAKDTTLATNDLRNILEKIRATPYALMSSKFPNATTDGPASNLYSTIVGGYTLTNEHISVTYANPNIVPLETKATLTWLDKGRHPHTTSISTFKAR